MRSQVTYAIADVHGRNDLLEALVTACLSDADRLRAEPRFVFLGDVCDKGRQTRLAMDTVAEVLSSFEGSEFVMGNHERLALDALTKNDDDVVDLWMERGGRQTLESYCPGDANGGFTMLQTLNRDHLRMMEQAVSHVRCGGFLLAHAGVDPAVALDAQNEHDLMWVRKPFLDHVGHLSSVVVHGHTVVGDLPVVTENRISLDTGAVQSGRLTAAVLEDDRVRFLQTDGSERRVVEVEALREDRGFGTCLDRFDGRRRLAA